VAGDRILVKDQASAFQNGLYNVTTLGTAGTPFVLTRVVELDTAADFAHGVSVFIEEGQSMYGSMLRSRAATYVIGTTEINFTGLNRVRIAPGDVFGPNRNRDNLMEDFTGWDADQTVTNNYLPGSKFSVFFTGTVAKASQKGTAEARRGIIELQTGTDPTGFACTLPNTGGPSFDITKRWAAHWIAKTPTVSDGTNTFLVRLGWVSGATTGATPTGGVYFEALSTLNWKAIAMQASTPTTVDTGIAQTTGYKAFTIIMDEVSGFAYFYIGAVLVASINTNLPNGVGSLRPAAYILKSAGTTSRSLYLDIVTIDQPEVRGLTLVMP
jgi:hypothetical protein